MRKENKDAGGKSPPVFIALFLLLLGHGFEIIQDSFILLPQSGEG
jgi:hypothetical protein